jgi:lysozyme
MMKFKNYNLTTGIDLIKEFEGCKLNAYKCPAGVWTIGYGTTNKVKEGDSVSQEQANRLLNLDVEQVANRLYHLQINYRLRENTFNAFLSFFYNLGFNNPQAERFKKGVDIDTIINNMLLYNKANGKILEGLNRRRKAEYDLANKV